MSSDCHRLGWPPPMHDQSMPMGKVVVCGQSDGDRRIWAGFTLRKWLVGMLFVHWWFVQGLVSNWRICIRLALYCWIVLFDLVKMVKYWNNNVDWFSIGGLVMDWKIGQGLIGLLIDWKLHGISGIVMHWQIGPGLADWAQNGIGLVMDFGVGGDLQISPGLAIYRRIDQGLAIQIWDGLPVWVWLALDWWQIGHDLVEDWHIGWGSRTVPGMAWDWIAPGVAKSCSVETPRSDHIVYLFPGYMYKRSPIYLNWRDFCQCTANAMYWI